MKKVLIGVLLATVLLAAAGCGKSESDAEKKAEAAAEGTGRGTITCEGDALSGESGLPADFPLMDGVTFVDSKTNGPTTIVDGYGDESLEGLYEEYKDRVQEAGYTVEFSEKEEDDAEVAYKTGGENGTEGMIALRGGDSCDNGNVSVHITNRPSE